MPLPGLVVEGNLVYNSERDLRHLAREYDERTLILSDRQPNHLLALINISMKLKKCDIYLALPGKKGCI